MKKIDESETQTVYEQDGGRMTVSKIGHGSMCFCNKCISSEQSERSKREDSSRLDDLKELKKRMDSSITGPDSRRHSMWYHDLVSQLIKEEEMRCSEHDGNVVREVQ